MRVEITIAMRDELVRRAAASRDEICGLLLGQGGIVAQLLPTGNVAAEPAIRFEIDPVALIAAHRAARGGGPAVIGHFHSHPSGVAHPSLRDAADAAPDGAIWLIVAGAEVSAWQASPNGALHGRFNPLALLVSGCAGPGDSPQGEIATPPR